MKEKNAILSSILVGAILYTADASSNDDSVYPHLFIGVKSGYQLDTKDSLKQNVKDVFPIGAFVGSQLTENWSWDIGYQYHGNYKSDNSYLKNKVGLFESGIRYDWYFLNDFSLYGRAGLAYWEVEKVDKLGKEFLSKDGFSPLTEVGFNYRITPHVFLNLAYQHLNNIGSNDIGYYDSDSLFLGLTYHFKGKENIVVPVKQERLKPDEPKKVSKLYESTIGGSVAFAFDSAEVREPRIILSELADFIALMNSYPQAHAEVLGHTDSVGTESYNKVLSKRRAMAIFDLLKDEVINRERIEVIGVGESNPVSTNSTREGRAKNRRVELKVLPFEY